MESSQSPTPSQGSNPFEAFINSMQGLDTFGAEESPPALPAGIHKATQGVAMTYIIPSQVIAQSQQSCLLIYRAAMAGQVSFSGAPSFVKATKTFYLNTDDLAGLAREVEAEMMHRGLRPIASLTREQTDEKGIFAKSLRFDDASEQFLKEITRLAYHFHQKYQF